ncbi:hypothetical protein EON82_01460 [bacterium]|nr:MAG: hypothetical protein EON82_01460 [bacterium]
MRITLDVPDELAESVEDFARTRGLSRDVVVADALRACFPPMSVELRAELDAWQAASEEDAAKLGL